MPPAQANPQSLATAVAALKQGVESLSGQRGSTLNRAVTFNDLIKLGLVTGVQASAPHGSTSLGQGGTMSGSVLPAILAYELLANNTGSEAVPTGTALTNLLDSVFGTLSGLLFYRGSAEWIPLDIGAEGEVLTVLDGVPTWQAIPTSQSAIALTANGTLLTVGGIALTL